jgi:hypothetical protein
MMIRGGDSLAKLVAIVPLAMDVVCHVHDIVDYFADIADRKPL